MVWYGAVGLGEVWYGTARQGMAWLDFLIVYRDFASVQAQLTAIKKELDQILSFVDGKRPATRVRIDVDASQLLDKKGKLLMSGTATVSTDHDLKVPLKWTDDVGGVSAPAASGTTATSDTPTVATADVGSDDLEIFVRSLAVGTAIITVTNGSLTDTISVVVTEPQATALDVDATDAVLVAKGSTG
jgi:hypothetical protein